MRVKEEKLRKLVNDIFLKCGLSPEDAFISTDALVLSDKRNIPSHGVRAVPRYVNGFKEGKIIPNAKIEILNSGESFMALDASGAMGMVSSSYAMKEAIKKAKNTGIAIVTVKNSNHFGIGAYYTLMAQKEDMIGMAFSNTARIGIPLFGTKPLFGTNPISFSAPIDENSNFTLDMSTTIVTRGFVDKQFREGKKLEEGLAINSNGDIETDPEIVLKCLEKGTGGLLPLGGNKKELGAHKGYGLALMVDILTGVLSGYLFGKHLEDTKESASRMAHSFMAIDISKFTDLTEFKNNMKTMTKDLKESSEEVSYPGEHSKQSEKRSDIEGVLLSNETRNLLKDCANSLGVSFDLD